MDELKAKFDQLLSRGDLKGALDVLNQASPNMSNDIILTQARLSGLQQNIRLGIISHSDAQINKNQITQAIMSISKDVFRDVGIGKNEALKVADPKPTPPEVKSPPTNEKGEVPIYFSYSWADDKSEMGRLREVLVDTLYVSLIRDGYNVKRDKVHVGYGESILKLMKDL